MNKQKTCSPAKILRLVLPEGAGTVMKNIAGVFARQVESRCNAKAILNGEAPCTVEMAIEKGIGSDERGVLYGVGKFLRESRYDKGGFTPGAWRGSSGMPWSRHGRIVMYGTSIVQGGCASRPGMAHTNILSRALNIEVINLGFSGSALGEPEVIQSVAAVPNPVLFVLDYEANTNSQAMETSLPEAIRILRRRHPRITILVISRIAFARDITHTSIRRERNHGRAIQANTVKAFREQGDRRIHFLDGSTLLGSDFYECTVDGVHPTDLGFLRMTRKLESVILKMLTQRRHNVKGTI